MNKLIQDIGFIQHIQKPKNAIKIPVTVYEKIDLVDVLEAVKTFSTNIKWFDGEAYEVTVI